MNRRDLLKTGIAGVMASSLALSGCNKKESVTENNDELHIIPKQTDTYKFSAPLLFHFDSIDGMAKLNKKFKKSQITTLYNSIPWPQSEKFNEWFMLYRGGSNPLIKTYSDFEKYVKYAMDKGFEVVYLMNSPKAFNDRDIEPFKKDFYKLLDNLWKTGIRKIKFANTQVAQLINEYNPEFELHVATILEYSNISQYRNLFHYFPNIKHICVPKDQNQNFKFLASLRKEFPKIEIELMVDEGCIKNCPTRFSCMASSYSTKYKLGCSFARGDYYSHILYLVLAGMVHPWDLPYYSALGINQFKMVPLIQRASDKDVSHIEEYLNIVEYGLDNEFGRNFLVRIIGPDVNKITHQELISYLPDIRYFIKHGHECGYRCSVDCDYCYKCAKKLEQKLMYG